MALAHVQDATNVIVAGLSGNLSITPTAGNTVVVFLAQTNSATSTYSISSSVGADYGPSSGRLSLNLNRDVVLWFCESHPGGADTITISANASRNYIIGAAEFSGFGGTVDWVDDDGQLEGTTSNSHTASAGTGVSSTQPCLVCVSGVLTATATECNPGSGYTEITPGFTNNQSLFEWQIFSSGCSNEVGAWSNTGTARAGLSVMILLAVPVIPVDIYADGGILFKHA